MYEKPLKATEDALLAAFRLALKSAKDGIIHSYFRFVEIMLTAVASEEVSTVSLDTKIEKCAQPSFSMDVFAGRAVTSTQFMCSAPTFIVENDAGQANKLKKPKS